MSKWLLIVALAAASGAADAADLCTANPYQKSEAQLGKTEFDSHCALCHQYTMVGRTPGNTQNESPEMSLLSDGDLKFLDNAGGNVPPLIGAKFFRKWDGKSIVDFSSTVSSAANSFPTKNFIAPKTYFLLAAYVLYRNCGLM